MKQDIHSERTFIMHVLELIVMHILGLGPRADFYTTRPVAKVSVLTWVDMLMVTTGPTQPRVGYSNSWAW